MKVTTVQSEAAGANTVPDALASLQQFNSVQIAGTLGCCEESVRRAWRSGKLKGRRVGKGFGSTFAEIQAFLGGAK